MSNYMVLREGNVCQFCLMEEVKTQRAIEIYIATKYAYYDIQKFPKSFYEFKRHDDPKLILNYNLIYRL